jgi:nucleotide-binding universal stress UspA family protein
VQSIAKTLQPRGLRIRTVVHTGKAAETIIEYAVQQEVSVIVMATHGHRGGDQWPLGSIAEKVLRSMQVPVLLIRATPSVASRGSACIPGREEDDGVYKTILVPLDGSDLAASILEHVVTLARGYGARLLLLTVGQPQPVALPASDDLQLTLTFQAEDYVDRVRASLATQGLEVSATVRIGDPASEILEVAQRHHVDLIIINSRGGEGAPSPFFGSVAAKAAGASPMPVLVFHAPRVPEGGG